MSAPRAPLFDRYTPARGVAALARTLGLSKHIARYGIRFAGSERRVRRAFAGYTPTGQDVFAATFMKSGTNWMMQIITQIAWRGAAEFEHIHDLVPWPETPSPGPIDLRDRSPYRDCPTGLRAIKTHARADQVPLSPAAKYIVVLRDPKEVIVSAYHFALPLFGFTDEISPQDWLEMNSPLESSLWLEHTLSWWALRDEPNVLVLFYADMKRDPRGAVQQVAGMMGVSLTEAELDAVQERSSLAHMKAHQGQFTPIPLPFARPGVLPKMIRRGAAGGADELYSPEELAHIDRGFLAVLEARGSDFPYREAFSVLEPHPSTSGSPMPWAARFEGAAR